MPNLIAAATFFVLLHLLVSGTRLRDALVLRLGPGPYMGLFSLASLAGIVWLGFAFAQARSGAGNDVLWGMGSATHGLQFVLQLIAVLFIIVIYIGATTALQTVWTFSDVMNGLMALPNLIGLVILSPLVYRETRAYFRGEAHAEDMQARSGV